MQADGLAAEEGADGLAVELKGAGVLALEEGAVGLAGVVLLGVDVGEADGADDEEPGVLNKFVSSSSISAEFVS